MNFGLARRGVRALLFLPTLFAWCAADAADFSAGNITFQIERAAVTNRIEKQPGHSPQNQTSNFQNLPTLARICTPENKRAWVSVSGFCHVLDFYGLGPTDLPDFPSGELVLKALTDEPAAIQTFRKSPFVKTENGLRYLLFDDASFDTDIGEAHRDQCLAMFAALNLPLSTPVRLKSGAYSLADLLSESLGGFSFDQRELAWSAMAFARYVPPQKEWTNRAGARMNFSELVRKLLRADLNAQKCAGIHVFEALILIGKADRKNFLLDEETRAELNSHLKTVVEEIIHNQREDGSWSRSWCAAVNDYSEPMTPFQMSFLVTGHLAEVLEKLEPPLRPPKSVFLNAARWTTNAMNGTEIRPNGFWVCPFTHAACGVHSALRGANR